MQWVAPSEKDAATDSLEKRLWEAADQFRANSSLSAAHYSQPVLGLIFLQFAEVRFVKLALILLVEALLLASSVVAQAQFTFTTNDGAITITGFIGTNYNVIVPSVVNGHPVVSIGEGAFAPDLGNSPATSVTIPDSVTNIGSGAFSWDTDLTNVTIGKGVIAIGDRAFDTCTSLASMFVDPQNPAYCSIAGVLFDENTNSIIQYPAGSPANSYEIPTGVTQIGNLAFSYCSLTNMVIPNSVISIGQYAFYFSYRLTSVAIPNSVITIGSYAFNFCQKLDSIIIPSSITNIAEGAFEDCSRLGSITVPASVTSIGGLAFDLCTGLTNVVIPRTVTSIGYLAFSSCSLTSVTIPSSVTNIGGRAFDDCYSLSNIYFMGNAPSADSPVFQDDNATAYYLPGTTGWSNFATNAGVATAFWFFPNPLILSSEPSFGIKTNGFGFTISWATNVPVVVDTCSNLANPTWAPVRTNTLNDGTAYFSDPQWTNYSGRFYRLRSP